QEVIELVARAHRLGGQVPSIVRVHRAVKGYASYDLDPVLGQTVKLARIVGQEPYLATSENLQHARGDAIIALVIVEPERCVGVDRIETRVLQLIGAHLVGKAKPAPFLLEVNDDAAAQFIEARQCQAELVAA